MLKQNFKTLTMLGMTTVVSSILISCTQGSQTMYTATKTDSLDAAPESTTELISFAPKNNNFRVSLTDAPKDDLKSVFVNVVNAELWLEKGGKSARLVIAKDLGMVDLLTLRNGLLMTMADITIPEGVSITQIRLILAQDNYAIKMDVSQCSLQTPSAQQSGIKIKLANPVTIAADKSYSLVLDFDAAKSVVVKGNGDCLLKPVLKVGAFTQVNIDDVNDDGSTNTDGEDVDNSDETDTSTGDDSGFDPIVDPDIMPPEISDPDVVNYFQ